MRSIFKNTLLRARLRKAKDVALVLSIVFIGAVALFMTHQYYTTAKPVQQTEALTPPLPHMRPTLPAEPASTSAAINRTGKADRLDYMGLAIKALDCSESPDDLKADSVLITCE